MAEVLTWQLPYLRGPRQRTRLFVDADLPPVVFACRVNQTFASLDMVMELTYDLDGVTVEGAYTDVLAGMTVLVGTSQGSDNIGICRVRNDHASGVPATSTKLYIGLTSEIPWADNLFLTVIDEFGLWAKPMAVDDDGAILVDGDVPYSDQNSSFAPVIVAGPARRVAKLTGAYVDIAFDLSEIMGIGIEHRFQIGERAGVDVGDGWGHGDAIDPLQHSREIPDRVHGGRGERKDIDRIPDGQDIQRCRSIADRVPGHRCSRRLRRGRMGDGAQCLRAGRDRGRGPQECDDHAGGGGLVRRNGDLDRPDCRIGERGGDRMASRRGDPRQPEDGRIRQARNARATVLVEPGRGLEPGAGQCQRGSRGMERDPNLNGRQGPGADRVMAVDDRSGDGCAPECRHAHRGQVHL